MHKRLHIFWCSVIVWSIDDILMKPVYHVTLVRNHADVFVNKVYKTE